MATRQSRDPELPPRRPARTPEARENDLINLSLDEIEKQIREGRASSQILSIYAKASTRRDRLEIEKLQSEKALLEAKVLTIGSAEKIEAKIDAAMAAFKTYIPSSEGDIPEEFL